VRQVSYNKKGQKIVTVTFDPYFLTVMMIFCSLYPFVLGLTTVTRLDVGKPIYIIPLLLFAVARFLTYLDETDQKGKYSFKVKGVKIPIKYLTLPLPFVFMLVNFNAYTLKSPVVFLIDWIVLSVFYYFSLISKKNATKLLKMFHFFLGLHFCVGGFYISLRLSTDLAVSLSFLCLITYFIGMLLIGAKQISINTSAVKEMVEKFLRFVRNLLRQIGRILSPKQNFYRFMNFLTKRNQKNTIAYDDIIEGIDNGKIYEDINEHPKYYFKNIRKFINLMLKIRYSYAYVLYSFNECGIPVDKTDTPSQLKGRLKKEYDRTDEHYVFNNYFSRLTSIYEIVRYGEKLPDPSEYADIENPIC
jgi:hypothetical protein